MVGSISSFPEGGVAVVVGSSGGVGAAMRRALEERFDQVIGLSRGGEPPLDVTDEASVVVAAGRLAALSRPIRLVFDATGVLQDQHMAPEKTWRQMDPAALARAFAINAIGPALLMKHFLPLLPREGKAVFATLSARVGSIGDNRLGGWYGYRASKAALNQFVRTAAVELARQRPQAVCVALHPGTVATALTAPHAARGLEIREPAQAAALLVRVIEGLTAADNGSFLDYRGDTVPW